MVVDPARGGGNLALRVVVTGAAGQLGTEVVRHLALTCGVDDETFALGRRELDVGNQDQVRETLGGLRPDVVVNCAARTAVDACEADSHGTAQVNALGVGHLAEACGSVGAHLVTVSTDYVFDGAKGEPYTESDATNPLSAYGSSKLAGEWAAGDTATIVRTSLVFGQHGSNAVRTVLAQLERGEVLRYVTDQISCPTSAADLAQTLVRLAHRRPPGLFHVTNQGISSRYGLARAVAEAAGFNPGERIVPIVTADVRPPPLAARPRYSALDCAALRNLGEPEPRPFSEPLREVVAALRQGA